MRNLNNFPDNIFEISGKRLMAFAIGFTIFGGGIGWLASPKKVRPDAADQVAFDYASPAALPSLPAADAGTVVKEWQYPQAMSNSSSGSSDEFDSTVITTDDYKKVWKFYADKIDYNSMVKGNDFAHGSDDNASVSSGDGKINRNVRNYNQQGTRYSIFNQEDPTHFVRVTLLPTEKDVHIMTFAYRKPTK